jgi:outer membrane protein TolC
MKIKTAYILLLLLLAGNAMGQTLDEYLTMAAENNPNLKSKYFRYQAALERVPQVGALPDPQLGFSFFIEPMERYMGDQIGSISLMQMFPWFGTLSAAKDEMSFMAKAKYEEFNEAKSTLFYEVRANWYALQLLEKEIAVKKENIELLKTMEQIAITRFKSGGGSDGLGNMQRPGNPDTGTSDGRTGTMNMTSQTSTGNASSARTMPLMSGAENMSNGGGMIDVLRVQIEMNELQNNLERLEDSKTFLMARFNQLLNRPAHEPVVLTVSITAAQLPVSLTDIPDSIKKNNPILLMLEQEEAAFMTKRKMKQRMGLPMIGLGLQYDIFRSRDDGESMASGRSTPMPMVTITLPIWRNKYNASVREADFLRQSVAAQKQDAGNQLMVSYEDALKDYRDAERRVKLYQTQQVLANQALNILIAQYTVGESRFEEGLRMQQQLLDYRLKYLDALIDGNIAVAMMERLMGR